MGEPNRQTEVLLVSDEAGRLRVESVIRTFSPAWVPRAFAAYSHRLSGGRELPALLDQALVSGVNFLTFALLGRALGIQEFGLFALAWAAVLLASNLQMALIVSPMMSVGPKQDAEHALKYFRAVGTQALCLALICSLCVYGMAIVSARWVPSWGFRPLALPLSAATGLYLLQDYTRRCFFTLRRAVAALTSDAISYLSQLGILWLMAFRHDLNSAATLWVIAATSLLAVLASVGLGCDLRLHFGAALSVARRHWPLVRWLAPSSVLQWLSLNLFVVSAPVYYGIAAAGALRACQNVVGVCHIWFLGLENVLPGEAARELHTNGADAMLRYVRRMLVRWGLITATLMLLIGLFPAFWLRTIYGVPYAQFDYVLRLYGVLYLMYFIAVPLRAGLQAMEFTAPLLWAYTAMTLFAALAAVPLAKKFGLPGVMVGLIATQLLFQAILASSLLVRVRRMRREQLLSVHSSIYRWNEEPWNENIEA